MILQFADTPYVDTSFGRSENLFQSSNEANPLQNDVGDLPNAELLTRAGEKFIDLHGYQTVVTSQVGVDSTLTASCY